MLVSHGISQKDAKVVILTRKFTKIIYRYFWRKHRLIIIKIDTGVEKSVLISEKRAIDWTHCRV
jgi:hypothetical protein